MKVETLTSNKGLVLKGPMLLKPKVFPDPRGFFFESWNQNLWEGLMESQGLLPKQFVQDNHSRSSIGVLRGLHYQLPPSSQGKLVRCVVGEIFDVAVDVRRSSPNFGQWAGVNLSSINHQQLWIPEGFAHGFLTLSESAEVLYKTTSFWSRDCECSIRWNDPEVAINWPLSEGSIHLSDKDSQASFLDDLSDAEVFL